MLSVQQWLPEATRATRERMASASYLPQSRAGRLLSEAAAPLPAYQKPLPQYPEGAFLGEASLSFSQKSALLTVRTAEAWAA